MPEATKAPVREQRGALTVRGELRDDILWVRLAPGSALDEVGLAKRFGVSRTPVREALLLLSGEGLVHFLPNRTTIVAPFVLDNLGDFVDTFLLLSRAAARSAAQCNKTDLKKLSRLVSQNRAAVLDQDVPGAFLADNEFRMEIASASGNMFQTRYFRQSLIAGHRTRVICLYPNASKDELLHANDLMHALTDQISLKDVEASDRTMSDLVMWDLGIVKRMLEPTTSPSMVLENHPVNLGANAV